MVDFYINIAADKTINNCDNETHAHTHTQLPWQVQLHAPLLLPRWNAHYTHAHICKRSSTNTLALIHTYTHTHTRARTQLQAVATTAPYMFFSSFFFFFETQKKKLVKRWPAFARMLRFVFFVYMFFFFNTICIEMFAVLHQILPRNVCEQFETAVLVVSQGWLFTIVRWGAQNEWQKKKKRKIFFFFWYIYVCVCEICEEICVCDCELAPLMHSQLWR